MNIIFQINGHDFSEKQIADKLGIPNESVRITYSDRPIKKTGYTGKLDRNIRETSNLSPRRHIESVKIGSWEACQL